MALLYRWYLSIFRRIPISARGSRSDRAVDTKLKWTVATREAQSVRRREAAKTSCISRSRARLLRFWLPTRRSLPTERAHRFDCYQNIDRYHRAIHSPDRGWSDRSRGLRANALIATGLLRRLSRSEQQLP